MRGLANELDWGTDLLHWGTQPLTWGGLVSSGGVISLSLSGGATNADPFLSLGGVKSSIAVPATLFGKFSTAQFSAGSARYRCVYVATDTTAADLLVWIARETPSASTTLAMGWGLAAVGATEQVIANQSLAPPGVVFASPLDQSQGIGGGAFTAGQSRALWIRYLITPTSRIEQETFALAAEGVV